MFKINNLKNNCMKFFFYFVFITITFSYCGKPCIESRGIEGAGLTITFFNNANNEYFYPENKNLSPYKIDSLRVKDSQGHLLTTPYHVNSDPVNPLKGFYVPTIYPIFIPQDDQAAFDSELTKYIYIKYNYNTFDTLKVVFKAKKEKCINNFEYIKVYYKNIILSESYNRPEPLVFTLNHS